MLKPSERFHERMGYGKGLINFNFTPGEGWNALSTEQRYEALLTMLDGPRVATGPVCSGRPRVDLRTLVGSL